MIYEIQHHKMVNAKYDLSHAFHTQIIFHPYKILQKKSYTNHSFEKEHTQMILKKKWRDHR